MSIQSQITRIKGNVSDSLYAVAAKGVTVPTGAGSDELPGLIEQIEVGTKLPALTYPATASDVFSGKEYINAEGTKQTGTFTIEEEVAEQESLILRIKQALRGKMLSGGVAGFAMTDRTTGVVYNLYVDKGKLMMEVEADAANMVSSAVTDLTTGINYNLYTDNGELMMEKVT